MKKNNKGFTLIELLAVITIMGILMLVGIPAIGRTIENVRRDSFANITGEYVNAVRNAINAEDLICKQAASETDFSNAVSASAAIEGTYYVRINTEETTTTDLMEKGGRSPYGNAHMYGYVKFVKEWDESTGKSKTTYTVRMQDSGKHGLKTTEGGTTKFEFKESELTRSNVVSNTEVESKTVVSGSTVANPAIVAPPSGEGALECKVQ